jgi:hypothetical protein
MKGRAGLFEKLLATDLAHRKAGSSPQVDGRQAVGLTINDLE